MGVAGPGADSTQRTDVDDAAVRSAEVRKSFSRDEKRAACIGVEDLVPLIESETFKRRGSEDCSVVDEDIETAKLS